MVTAPLNRRTLVLATGAALLALASTGASV